jgi:hypothetical protein
MANLTGLTNLVVNSLELIDPNTGSQSEVRTLIANNSVKGEKGDQGIQGLAGLKGDQGAKGETLVQTQSGPTGDKGDKGEKGVLGPPGLKGDLGYQGVPGNDGAKGDAGPAGVAGAKGDAGPAGVAGAKGDAGPAGVDGAKGDAGLAGVAGAKGDAGPAGVAGAKGDAGPAGVAGAKGDTGAAGAKGDKGSKGAAGTSGTVGNTIGLNITAPPHNTSTASADPRIDIRNGSIDLSQSAFSGKPNLRWTCFSGIRYETARIEMIENGAHNGSLAFYTRATNNNTNPATETMRLTQFNGMSLGTSLVSSSHRLWVQGNAHIAGTLSKTSGSFDIEHPKPPTDSGNWRLRHYFCETGQGPGLNIYRYKLTLQKGVNSHRLPDWFSSINTNCCVLVAPCKHFNPAYGEVEGNTLIITTKAAAMYICIIYADRCDEAALNDFHAHGGDSMQYEFEFEKDQSANVA